MLNGYDLLVEAAGLIAADLAADAARVEREGVERETLDRLAAAGLYGLQGPLWAGGSDVPGAVYRQIAEGLAAADGNTWLVWFQHHAVVRILATSENTDLHRHLPDLCAGRMKAGVAFSHLRNETPTIAAHADGNGWRLSGRQPWCTGWGMTDVILVGAITDDDHVLFALVPTTEGDGLKATDELDLMAMGGTHTVALDFDGLAVSPADVLFTAPREDWSNLDAMRSSNVQPSAVGIALAALAMLAVRAPEAASVLGAELADLRTRAYELSDLPATADDTPERHQVTARLLMLGVQITSTLVVSLGGSALTLDKPAQRWAREATFHLVFAQTSGLRQAGLAAAVAR